MKYPTVIILLALFFSHCRPKKADKPLTFPGKPLVPESIKKEHAALLARLHPFTFYKGSTARVALKLETLIVHHFREEEDYVLPPLGLLPMLAGGQIPEQKEEILKLIEKMKSQRIHMDAEHQMIRALLDELKNEAEKENRSGITEFDQALRQHADTEQEILFPAAILIGEYLKINPKNPE